MDTLTTGLKPYVTVSRNQKIPLPEKPKIIGHFSIDYPFESSQIRLDASNCKYFRKELTYKKDFIVDLREFDSYREDYVKDTHLKYMFARMPLLLEYLKKLILKSDFVKHSDNKLFSADIICDKSFLKKVLRVPGDWKRKFSFLCTKYKGNIYICDKLQEKPKDYDVILTRHVFCSDKPQSDTNSSIPGFAKFFGVFNMKLQHVNLMYCGCLRGIDSETEINAETDLNELMLVDFCMHKRHDPLKPEVFEKYVTPSWWLKIFTLGSDEIHIAEFRDSNIIDKMETLSTTALLQEYERKWSKSSTNRVSFLNLFVEFIILRMKFIDCPYTVYKFDYSPEIDRTIQYSIHKGQNEFTFLNDDYRSLVEDL